MKLSILYDSKLLGLIQTYENHYKKILHSILIFLKTIMSIVKLI